MKENDIPDNRCRYLGHSMWMGEIIQWSCCDPMVDDRDCPFKGSDRVWCPLNEVKE